MSEAPKLRNDCFALPAGVDWTPVDTALDRLRAGLGPLTGAETVPLDQAIGRILAAPLTASRANPPAANAAVDGYGLTHADIAGAKAEVRLPLAPGRAAAGAPLGAPLPPGHAVRILTGASLPQGVDTVILQEDVVVEDGAIRFAPGLKPGANCRAAGEDVAAGDTLFPAGRRLGPQDLALAAATGAGGLAVRAPLRVGVLSTGDELVPAGQPTDEHQIFDANRPMLLALIRAWGFEAVDLGHAADDRATVRAQLDAGARAAHAVLTTGGASAGDEDHISATLAEAGVLQTWRIAVKPGRPLALANWGGVPIFGLPGNPVAAFVCALIFARPALLSLAGAGWTEPQAITVPAAFSKAKKPGRREYLRARLNPGGAADVFASEGSGRISGLSWADGLVELPDGAAEIAPGTPVRYLPFASFGL